MASIDPHTNDLETRLAAARQASDLAAEAEVLSAIAGQQMAGGDPQAALATLKELGDYTQDLARARREG